MAAAGTELISIPHEHDLEDIEACKSFQLEELEVLESIFPGCISNRQPDGHFRLEVPENLFLSILPPILLRILLPPAYPSHCPPTIVSIRATNAWLSDTSSLNESLVRMWKPEEAVLYLWIEYMRSGDFLRDLKLFSDDNSFLQIPHPNPSMIAPLLSAYDSSSQSAQFSINSYPCGICLENLKGTKCVQLACGHVFCRSCLEDFWGMCISEGDVDRVGCPDPDCVKVRRKASGEDVSRVVTELELQRWKWLTTKQELERDQTILNCPIPTCQNLVPKPKDVDPESGWDRFRQCSSCSFSFCSFCKRTWHGPLSACPLPFTDKLLSDYLAAPENSPERNHIELRYGKGTVVRLLAQYEEQKATESWITESTSVCPGCQSHVQKSEGCNHMTCTRCMHHFCYRCGAQLDAKNPYAHFSIKGTYCFEKLFAADDIWEPDVGDNVDDGEESDEGVPFGLFD
ncbi:hypothetical protein BJ912DRAFT_943537 [Pholiota molesta]|nr:hypothetical protein BJ912DRAFT_943537 [Pholiota molesta]